MKRWMSVSVGVCAAVALVAACDGKSSPSGDVGGGGGGNWYMTDATTGGWESSSFSASGLVGAPPDMTPVVLAADPPPALSGGTLLLASDGVTAVAADPDRDAVWWTDVSAGSPSVQSVMLNVGDEPGRVVQDKAGLIHVALRRGGAVATIDLAAAKVVRRVDVCPAPRGIAYDAAADAIVVACVGGELVTLAAADGAPIRSLQLESDLRDVVALGSGFLAVSKLRSAEVLLLDANGVVHAREKPSGNGVAVPAVAWRMVAVPGWPGAVAVAHQLASTETIDLSLPSGYSGGPFPDIVTSALSLMHFDLGSPDTPPSTSRIDLEGALPVDLALNAGGDRLAVAMYGQQSVSEFLNSPGSARNSYGDLAATSVVYKGYSSVIAFIREPASFVVLPGNPNPVPISVPGKSVLDTGHNLFHHASRVGGSLACASCHPEGRDDGRVWQFNPIGPRRTPSLVGGVMATAPFHWDGDLHDLDALMTEVFTHRMGGFTEDAAHVAALARFVDAIPRVPIKAPPPSASFDNGKALFESQDLGCTGCHVGPHLTSNATIDVGTGQPVQVPTLIGVGLRAPYLHNGCAATLPDRFGPCGGGDKHGHTSQLTKSDVMDLALYVGSL